MTHTMTDTYTQYTITVTQSRKHKIAQRHRYNDTQIYIYKYIYARAHYDKFRRFYFSLLVFSKNNRHFNLISSNVKTNLKNKPSLTACFSINS